MMRTRSLPMWTAVKADPEMVKLATQLIDRQSGGLTRPPRKIVTSTGCAR